VGGGGFDNGVLLKVNRKQVEGGDFQGRGGLSKISYKKKRDGKAESKTGLCRKGGRRSCAC